MTRIPTQVNFSIPDLFKSVFGLYARFPVYFIPKSSTDGSMQPYELKEFVYPDNELSAYLGEQKPFGTIVWDQIGFGHPDFATDNPEATFYLPLITTVEISQAKNIVKTSLVGNNGTIKGTAKELMSEDDTIITFRGFAINFDEPNKYPEQEVKALSKLFGINDSLPVFSKVLAAHDIESLVFTNKDFPPFEGYANVQPFEFTALSDNPIILEL
jgi:hypothetical protein